MRSTKMATRPNRDEIVTRVSRLAAEQVAVDPATVTLTTHFESDLNYDSLDQVEFTMEVEDAFDIHLPDDRAAEVRTVGDAVDVVVSLVCGDTDAASYH
jgi:acyl carrier protein